ncbi:MAG: hypothetical protein AABZ47_16960 [Planctomycetota bacterium]
MRSGAMPAYDGSGWLGECFLNIPAESATDLIAAERHVLGRVPDFTFRTDWIDFPAGPSSFGLDADFATMGDFLNDYIREVSDPGKLNENFGHFLLRFSGFLKVSFDDDIESGDGAIGLPIWVEFGCMGHDGYRTKVGEVSYRIPIVNPVDGFYHENFIIDSVGMFPIRVTYFNRYDPNGNFGAGRAGIEFYSWHGGGLAWPAGEFLVHAVHGTSTIVPPRIIYSESDNLPLLPGDYDADADSDLRDAQFFQNCYTGDGEEKGGFNLDLGCEWLDFEEDRDVDLLDFGSFQQVMFER